MNTTLFNHKPIGSIEKPIIPNLVFKELCEAIRKGDLSTLEKVRQEYTLVRVQLDIIDQLVNKL